MVVGGSFEEEMILTFLCVLPKKLLFSELHFHTHNSIIHSSLNASLWGISQAELTSEL